MTAVQMNLRIDAEAKEKGDAALSEAGYSPTQAVRILWAYAANHAHNPAAIRELMMQAEAKRDSTVDTRRAQVTAALDKCRDLRKNLEDMAGYRDSAHAVDSMESASVASEEPDGTPGDDRRLRAEALLSRWDERGLL